MNRNIDPQKFPADISYNDCGMFILSDTYGFQPVSVQDCTSIGEHSTMLTTNQEVEELIGFRKRRNTL